MFPFALAKAAAKKEDQEELTLDPTSRITSHGTWPELYREYGDRILTSSQWQKELRHHTCEFVDNPQQARNFFRERVWTGTVLNYRDGLLEWDVEIDSGILYRKQLDPYDIVVKGSGRSYDLKCGIPRSSCRIGDLTPRYQGFVQRLYSIPKSEISDFRDARFVILSPIRDRMAVLRGGGYAEQDDIFVANMFAYSRPARIR